MKLKFLAIALVAIVALLGTTSPVSAASIGNPYGHHKKVAIQPMATCSGTGCDDLDPVQTGCANNVSTLVQSPYFSSNGQTWVVQLRYSNICQTAWTRLIETSGSGAALYNPVSEGAISLGFACLGSTCGAYPERLSGVYDGAWTNMTYVATCGTGYRYDWFPAAWQNYNVISTSTSNYTTCTY